MADPVDTAAEELRLPDVVRKTLTRDDWSYLDELARNDFSTKAVEKVAFQIVANRKRQDEIAATDLPALAIGTST